MITEEIATFRNRDGERLFGILSVPPESRKKDRGILLLNTGINPRDIWHRLNVKVARLISEAGYPVLRFDPHGTGDSEGELPAASIFEHYVAVEQGRFAADTSDAIDYFLRTSGCREVVLIGWCGGAITAMLTAARERRVCGVVHIAGPVTLSASARSGNAHPAVADDILGVYLRKISNPAGLWRLLSGKSDYRAMGKALWIKCGALLQRKLASGRTLPGGAVLNTRFIEAFRDYCASGRKVLFLFAERDAATWDFEHMFRQRFITGNAAHASQCCIHIVGKTNHIFSSSSAQETLLAITTAWLRTQERGGRSADVRIPVPAGGWDDILPGVNAAGEQESVAGGSGGNGAVRTVRHG